MYEPETISEINENKKYILAGYDEIPEEKYNENKYENINSEESSNKINNNKKNNLFFEEYNNTIKRKPLSISTDIKNKININNNIYPQSKSNKYKNMKNNIKYNINISKINQEKNTPKKDINKLPEINDKNNDNDNNNSNINSDENNNVINTLSLNSYNNTDRKDIDDSFKNKKIKGHKLSKRDSLAQNNMQVREINIRFILTKEEYAILMKEKAKIQDILNN
jgi:hypothetical protein